MVATVHMKNYNKRGSIKSKWYQQGVPTKVFLERCLSPVSNIHADTPKSATLTAPLESSKIFPACIVKNVKMRNRKDQKTKHERKIHAYKKEVQIQLYKHHKSRILSSFKISDSIAQ